MEFKQNQTFFHGTYTNLTPYRFLWKNIKVFQLLSKSKFLSFMTKVNPNNGNETKSGIFLLDIFKSNIILFYQKILKYRTYLNLISFFTGPKIPKYFNDFYNWNLQFHCRSEHKQVK